MQSDRLTVDPSLEIPVHEPDKKLLVNTYNFTAYDPQTNIGLLMYLNSVPGDSTLWRHGVMVYHPSGDAVWSKGYGRGNTTTRFGSSNLTFECNEPFREWTIRFDGFGQRTPPGFLRNQLLWNDVESPLSFEVVFKAMTPVCATDADGVVIGTHYEQNGHVVGAVRYEGRAWEFDGVGFRDRILGPKDTSAMRGHSWVHGTWGSGKAFALTVVSLRSSDVPAIASAYLYENGSLSTAEIVQAPSWEKLDQDPSPATVELKTDTKSVVIDVVPIHGLPLMYVTSPHTHLQSALFGHDRSRSKSIFFWDCVSVCRWDGEDGHGIIEYSIAT